MPNETTEGRLESRFQSKFATVMGLLLLAVAALCNQWLLGALLSPDGVIDDPADLTVIWCFQAILFAWGGLNVAFRRRAIVAKINLLIISLCLVSPLVGECAFRAAIATGVPAFRNAGLYADALSDDDHWKLTYLWSDNETGLGMVPDALLGWAPATSPSNPLGIIADKPYEVDFQRPAILFYGDSFVDSPGAVPDKLPQQLDSLLPDVPVYNYGVSGYGVDQIFLRAKATHERFSQPTLLVGILTSDLDRCVLTFRGAPKPYFEVRDGQLLLQGTPIDSSRGEFVQAHPPQIWSYLYSFIVMRYRLHQPGPLREVPYKLEEKKTINRYLLQDLVSYCRAQNLPLTFILFYDPMEFAEPGWRETFLLDELTKLQADFLDTKIVLQAQAARESGDIAEYYRSDHHLNQRGNAIVARAIAAHQIQSAAARSAAESGTALRAVNGS